MSEISSASREQATGIEEINTALTQMDDVTRQNASLVEESAAAAASLQAQADTLVDLVAFFHLDEPAIFRTRRASRTSRARRSRAPSHLVYWPPAPDPFLPRHRPPRVSDLRHTGGGVRLTSA